MDSDSSGPYPARFLSGCFPRSLLRSARRGGINIF